MRQSCNDYLLTDLPEADEMEGNAHASQHARGTHGTLAAQSEIVTALKTIDKTLKGIEYDLKEMNRHRK